MRWLLIVVTHDNQEMSLWDKGNIVDQSDKTILDPKYYSIFEQEKLLLLGKREEESKEVV